MVVVLLTLSFQGRPHALTHARLELESGDRFWLFIAYCLLNNNIRPTRLGHLLRGRFRPLRRSAQPIVFISAAGAAVQVSPILCNFLACRGSPLANLKTWRWISFFAAFLASANQNQRFPTTLGPWHAVRARETVYFWKVGRVSASAVDIFNCCWRGLGG